MSHTREAENPIVPEAECLRLPNLAPNACRVPGEPLVFGPHWRIPDAFKLAELVLLMQHQMRHLKQDGRWGQTPEVVL